MKFESSDASLLHKNTPNYFWHTSSSLDWLRKVRILSISLILDHRYCPILGKKIHVPVEVNEQVTSIDIDLTVESRNDEFV